LIGHKLALEGWLKNGPPKREKVAFFLRRSIKTAMRPLALLAVLDTPEKGFCFEGLPRGDKLRQ
jgi:hypothetical protein